MTPTAEQVQEAKTWFSSAGWESEDKSYRMGLVLDRYSRSLEAQLKDLAVDCCNRSSADQSHAPGCVAQTAVESHFRVRAEKAESESARLRGELEAMDKTLGAWQRNAHMITEKRDLAKAQLDAAESSLSAMTAERDEARRDIAFVKFEELREELTLVSEQRDRLAEKADATRAEVEALRKERVQGIERKLQERRLACESNDPEVLLPCPWCDSHLVRGWYFELGGWCVSCKNCLGKGPWMSKKKEAIVAWNTRALTPQDAVKPGQEA